MMMMMIIHSSRENSHFISTKHYFNIGEIGFSGLSKFSFNFITSSALRGVPSLVLEFVTRSPHVGFVLDESDSAASFFFFFFVVLCRVVCCGSGFDSESERHFVVKTLTCGYPVKSSIVSLRLLKIIHE